MQKIGVSQIHMIPFDLGAVFYDVLSIDNTKNLQYAELFCDKLAEAIRAEGWKLTKLFTVDDGRKGRRRLPSTIRYKTCDFADQTICRVEIEERLICYILSSGVGIFELADLEGDVLSDADPSIADCGKVLIANYQKKVTQAALLNKDLFSDACREIKAKMLQLRRICWAIIAEGVKRKQIAHLRPFSGNENYKAQGLSYVLTIYLLEREKWEEEEIHHLLCSSCFSKATDREKWKEIEATLEREAPQEKAVTIKCGTDCVYASWSAVAVITSPLESIEKIRENKTIAALLKVEAYVQSRWFVADNSMDNVNKNAGCTMESLQRIASLMEFCQAELDNEISANMSTMQKNILKPIVETSEVKQLYKSVLSQIKTQLKIKEAYYQDKKSKNRLMVDLFLAVFTASSLYKTVMDIVNEQYTLLNSLIFGFTVILAVGIIIFNYKNK